jgi:histidinol-phosphate aminotransferase
MIKAKNSIERLVPYLNGNHSQKLISQHKKVMKLDSNESTASPSPHVVGAIMHYIQDGPLNWYPDVEAKELSLRLSRYTSLPHQCLLTFNGSDHALETIARTFLTIDDEVIHFTPTYDHFRVYAQSCDAIMKPLHENKRESLVDLLAPAVTEATRLVYVVNPNNPTGFLFTPHDIQKALTTFPHILFIIDEAYYEFCGITAGDLVIDHKNLIVTRSFSKAFGLAALRCGYVMAHPELCEKIGKIRVGKNINAIAQVAACAALDDIDTMNRYVQEIKESKDWLLKQLEALGVEATDTPANYILIRVAQPKKLVSYLKQYNVYLRDRSQTESLSGCVRLTVGDQLMMKRFWKIFESVPAKILFTAQEQQKQSHSV